jgi:hypothetical protein
MGVFTGSSSSSPGTDFEAISDRVGFPNRSSDPSPASAGDVYYNTSDNKLKLYNGSAWETIGGGGQGTLFVDDGNSESVFVPTICNTLTICGVARGGTGGQGGNTNGAGGGGGGAANITGYDVAGAPLRGSTILVRTNTGDAIVHSGSSTPSPKIFHAQAGQNGQSSGFSPGYAGGEGGTMAVGTGVAGGDGGSGGARHNPGVNGSNGATGGGGGGGGFGDGSPEIDGKPGGTGGNATVPGSQITPNGTGPFGPFSSLTAQPGLQGGENGESNAGSYRTPSQTTFGPRNFPLGSEGGKQGQSTGAADGGGGGAGGGIVFNGNAYGGGGGGGGSFGGPAEGGEGGGSFVLILFS